MLSGVQHVWVLSIYIQRKRGFVIQQFFMHWKDHSSDINYCCGTFQMMEGSGKFDDHRFRIFS